MRAQLLKTINMNRQSSYKKTSHKIDEIRKVEDWVISAVRQIERYHRTISITEVYDHDEVLSTQELLHEDEELQETFERQRQQVIPRKILQQ